MALSLRSRPISLVAVAGLVAIAAAGSLSLSTTAHATPISLVRIDQVGYLPSDAKHAYLMASGPVGRATWDVVDRAGKVVERGKVGTSNRGPWNANYPDVYDITFSGLTKLGTYHLHVHGDVTAASPSFEVETASDLFGQLLKDGVNFFQVQRDGSDVIKGDLNRQPAHLADAHATVYEHPLFVDASQSDSTLPGVDLKKVTTGPTKVDAEGGWYDAADFLKFTHTNAYGDVLLYASQRALGSSAPATLKTEAQFGETFLDKMWSMSTKTLYSQVGIGGDNGDDTHDPTFLGDHDLWRLPQADTTDTDPLDRYAATSRPVFRAAPPGQPISPNLVGRVSAAFALAAQVDAKTDRARAEYEYTEATSLYAMADTASPPDPLVTADPFGFYPESSWHDDMELGAAEIALASQSLGHNAKPYLSDGARWAKAYIAGDAVDNPDTFNLYDVSALAHTDLVNALAKAGNPKVAVTKAGLVKDVKRQ
ncbi:MAG: endoglucanase, partial [Actinomycetota bacterium]|nr:endoglucanase [Actinomycetota bacterium]